MNALTPAKIEEVVTSQGRPPESWLKPERDLSTPRGRLLAIRDVFVSIPANRIDMHRYLDGTKCGCALHHAEQHGIDTGIDWQTYFGLTGAQLNHLFAADITESTYHEPTGAPAKAEFLRRIDAILETSPL